MQNVVQRIVIAFLVALSLPVFGQTPSAEALLVNKWRLAYYEESGERIPPAPDQRNDVMDMHADHTVVSVESGGTQNGRWTYDGAKKQLVVVDNATKERMVMRVVSLDEKTCVLEFKDEDGIVLRIHMVPM